MEIVKELFGRTKKGETAYLYTLTNQNGVKMQVTDFGAILVRLFVPDKHGKLEDVVLGFDKLEDYFENGDCFGATIGPNANRIADASFSLHGKKYALLANDGKNNLHSDGSQGYHKRMFTASVKEKENSITFSLQDPDGSMGFPGNKNVAVTYCLTEKNEVRIHYHVTSDADTIINMTNHSYFNLGGHKAGYIGQHILKLYAARYTPVVAGAIPTGELAAVAGTPMDFTTAKTIDRDIHEAFEQLDLTGGFDHNWVIDGEIGTLRKAAEVEEPESGRKMTVYTDLPGVQFYAGNFIDNTPGKEGFIYKKNYGLALETQFYPNTANEESFPSAVFGPDRPYDTTTVYQFE